MSGTTTMKRITIFAACLLAVATTICDAGSYTLSFTNIQCVRQGKTSTGSPTGRLVQHPTISTHCSGASPLDNKPYFTASYDELTLILTVHMAGSMNAYGADRATYFGPPNNLRLIRGDANTTWPATLQLTP